jgi:arginine/serine-rich splicing factor 1/9
MFFILFFSNNCFLNLLSNICFSSNNRDAEDAVHSRDGYDYDGYKLRVEFPRGKERGPGGAFTSGGRSGERSSSGGGGNGSSGGRGRGPPARRSQYRVTVSGIKLFLI